MAGPNADVARAFRELALLTQLAEGSPQAFRVRAYENAAHAVEELATDVSDLTEAELVAMKGIGRSSARKIREFLETGTLARLEKLRADFPPAFVELTRIPGVGPKTAILLRDRLGVENVDDLRRAIDAQALRDLPGLGAKSEEKLRAAIERLGLHGKERRTPIADALPLAEEIVAVLEALGEVQAIKCCGSLRRFNETIGDIDVLAASRHPVPVMEAFVGMRLVERVLGRGDTKSSVVTREGLQIDLRVVEPHSFGAAVLYFTGSKAHNIALRQVALERGWTLNEYALSDAESEEVVASRTEKAIYRALGLQFIPPPMREDAGEIEAAAAGKLPRVVDHEDLRGDTHVHTSLSGDGRASLEKMVAAAAERGLDYVAITDHGENLAINGVSRDKMLRQRRRIAGLREEYPDMALLHGCELNIGADGGLDYDDDFLMGFDWCVASVHSHFDLEEARQTKRILAAMEHPAVNAIGHLTGRMIGRRPGIDLNVEAVLEAAAGTGTALEINGALDRLDAPATVIRRGAELGVRFLIATDSHHPSEFRRARWGVLYAQRGWLERKHVANTWPKARFLRWVASRRKD